VTGLTWSIRVFPCGVKESIRNGFETTYSVGTCVWKAGTTIALDAHATLPNEPFFFKDYLVENWGVDPVLMCITSPLPTFNGNS
jgi:hypothetical protein